MKPKSILCLLYRKDSPIEAKILDGLTRTVASSGYTPVPGIVPFDPRSEVRRLIEKYGTDVAGIAIQPYLPNRELAELLLTPPVRDLPHIIIGHYFKDLKFNACVADNYGGMYAATEYLIRCGRRRLSFLGEIIPSSTEHERYLGFIHACLFNGIQVPREWIIYPGQQSDLYQHLKSQFGAPDHPDALVCMDDHLASRVLKILGELGIGVPRQVAVISFGDDPEIAEQCTPQLSSAYHPARELGVAAAELLIKRIEAKVAESPEIFVLPVGMHIRESSGVEPQALPNGKTFWRVPYSNHIGHCFEPAYWHPDLV